MSSKNSTVVGIVVAALIIGAVASIGYYQFAVSPGQTTSPTTSVTTAGCTPTTCVNVTIPQNSGLPPAIGYSPGTITVVIGVNSTVVWTNADSVAHTVTANDNSFNSGNLAAGRKYTHAFTTAGTFQYICSYHSNMHGTVIVKSP
ncbi:MAG: cupredoxin domain-containing protein [Thaumarchaeota archaeon]|nr:cupredoxin domain-containing protein [Nitrososphaerota archaeon]